MDWSFALAHLQGLGSFGVDAERVFHVFPAVRPVFLCLGAGEIPPFKQLVLYLRLDIADSKGFSYSLGNQF